MPSANRRHYRLAAEALVRADRKLLERLITRRVPLPRASRAMESGVGSEAERR